MTVSIMPYSLMLEPAIEQILRENPSIEVVIDLHRDGVAEGTRLVTEVDGTQMASIMFFNGLSRTTALGDISYLKNPYIQDNLAFSFQMQLKAAEYYPGLARPIYLKGYRYNDDILGLKSLSIEAERRQHTYREAKCHGPACGCAAPGHTGVRKSGEKQGCHADRVLRRPCFFS
ncbi:MAG: stage II sporulation protein P [Roseburia sp.]